MAVVQVRRSQVRHLQGHEPHIYRRYRLVSASFEIAPDAGKKGMARFWNTCAVHEHSDTGSERHL